jgi:hypothetical protein
VLFDNANRLFGLEAKAGRKLLGKQLAGAKAFAANPDGSRHVDPGFFTHFPDGMHSLSDACPLFTKIFRKR